ncbi:MAG: hypothetical protein ACJ8LM_12305 [Candidatus Udaeobacter sp.]
MQVILNESFVLERISYRQPIAEFRILLPNCNQTKHISDRQFWSIDGCEAGSNGDQLNSLCKVTPDESKSGIGSVIFDDAVTGVSHVPSSERAVRNQVPDDGTTAKLLRGLTGGRRPNARFRLALTV